MFFSCDTCIDTVFDQDQHRIPAETVLKATKNGYVPFKLRDMAASVKNPNATAEDVWLHMLKNEPRDPWTLCDNCHTKLNGHLEDALASNETQYDTFISYATEDTEFANRLAGGLVVRGVKIWYAPTSLSFGDSILSGIEEGLRLSRTGTIVLSEAFLAKAWTKYELDILLRQAIEKKKLLLQVWHNVTKEQIEERYMGLTGILAIDSSAGLRKTIGAIANALTEFAPLRGTTPEWESPRYRFLNGTGEIQLQKKGGATISLFELLVNFTRDDFPLALDGELFTRRDLARYAQQAIAKDPGIAQRWTDRIDVLHDVFESEGVAAS